MGDLTGKRIAVLVEHKFIPDEIEAYRTGFSILGAEVEFFSRIWYGNHRPNSVRFYSDVDPLDSEPWETPRWLEVTKDISSIAENLERYAALIMAANYTSVRLRWDNLPKPSLSELTEADIQGFNPVQHVQQPPAVRLFAKAMENKAMVKGALCHGLWVLTPNPHLLRERKVICHTVVMADVLNCKAHIELNKQGVVIDDDLVTGFSKHEVLSFIKAVADCIQKKGDRL